MKYFVNFLMVLSFLSGCESEEDVLRGKDAGYFPLQTGVFQVYDVKEKRYSVTSDPVESTYQVMTHIVDSFPTGPNVFTYVIHRSRRTHVSDEWKIMDTWSVRNENSTIVLAEGNTAFVKLRLPLAAGDKWNGNSYNARGEDEYRALGIDQPLEVNGMTFDKTVTIEQERNEDVIVYRDVRSEVYARGVGMIYKEIIQLDYCTADQCLGLQKVDEGVEMKMTIVEYGKL